jgi:hypothetical protein
MGIFSFNTVSRPALEPIQWVPGHLLPRVKHLIHGAEHSPASGAKFKNVWRYSSVPLISLHGVVLT